METYEFNYICNNCQVENTLVIKKGETTISAIAAAVCTNCGCNIKQ